jgi:hypothetical protein
MVMAVISIILGAIFGEGEGSEGAGEAEENEVHLPGWVDGVAILVTVSIVALVSSVNNWCLSFSLSLSLSFFLLLLLLLIY